MMRHVLRLAVVTGLAAVGTAGATTPQDGEGGPKRPNILLIVADDLGWKDLGYHGAEIRTPNIDELVRTGVELDSHYVQPVCTPTRAALLSGRYPGRFGPHALAPSNLRVYPKGTETLASMLKSVGYATYLTGKWHLGSRPEWSPNHYGFDASYGSLTGAVDPWTHRYRHGAYERTWHHDGVIFDEDGNATELVVEKAVGWIKERKAPWFVYVPFQAVHIPIDTPPEYKKPYADRKFYDDPVKNESYRRFAAFVSQLDAKVGQLIATLDETGQRDNTLVIFTSDNGGLAGGGNAYVSSVPPTPVLSSNLPLRGFKNQLYEGGIRVAACANWPGKLTPRKLTAPLHAVDWTPTLTRLAGYEPKQDPHWDGRDVWPLLTGAVDKPEPRSIYIAHPSGQAILRDGWKLIAFKKNGRRELYHLAEDPYETTDLAAKEPARVEELAKLIEEFRKDDRDDLPEDLKGLSLYGAVLEHRPISEAASPRGRGAE